jgi:catechol 2,3-dioxygenase-like lactoylglutathione lyase family enzyme
VSKVLFDHIAIAIPRMADAPAVLAGVLGGVPSDGASSPVFNWGVWRFEGGGDLEILEPRGGDGFVHRFLAARGAGIHHVTFKVPSLDEACERAEARGYTIVGRDDSDPTWMEAFLHPRQALGIVVQFAEERVRRPAGRRWTSPPGPPNPPPPVRVLGLRMRARSREAARRQWQEVLLGESEPGEHGALIYRWPGSPMRLVVEIDATAEEGPLAIEYASSCVVALPDGPHPVLGARFVQRVSEG